MKVRLLLPARRELKAAVNYYNLQRTNLGTEFRAQAWAAIQRVKEFPLAWHPRSAETFGGANSSTFHTASSTTSRTEIVVIAVACLHQAPEYWRDRVE